MKAVLLLALALGLVSNCVKHTNPQPASRMSQTPQSTRIESAQSRHEVSQEREKKETPLEFRGIDFKNLSYPLSWGTRRIRLNNGHVEYYQDKVFGNAWFDFKDVYFVDLMGDGKEQAVVQLISVVCGASCDGGSDLFYFYSIDNGKLKLFWRIETGSLGYGGGLKSFAINKRILNLEAFGLCQLKGVSVSGKYGANASKFIADEITRFTFAFNRNKFRLIQREVFPNPRVDVKNYQATVNISND